MRLTARAIGILEELLIDPKHGSAIGLSKRLGEGRDAIQNALSDLRSLGLIETTTVKTGKLGFSRNIKVTDAGYQFLKSRTSILLSQLNPNNNLLLDINTDLISHKQNSKARIKMEYEDTPMYIDPEDLPEFRRKQREQKHKDKMEQHDRNFVRRMKSRDESFPESWTVTDSCFEFAHQMKLLWHIAPWRVTNSRFRFALTDKRNEYNTDGAIEQKMMKLFFDKIKHDTKINDPEKIWRRFIVEFGALVDQVKRESATPEQLELEQEKSMKSRSILYVQE